MLFPMLRRKKLHGILLDSPRDGDERCLGCGGICCNSFTSVEISWEEFQLLKSLGARRLQLSLYGPHRLVIDCGCEFLVGGRCSIYENRPEVCRRFTCSD